MTADQTLLLTLVVLPAAVGAVLALTRAERVSRRTGPQTSSAVAWPAARRTSARSRASTSSIRNGLAT